MRIIIPFPYFYEGNGGIYTFTKSFAQQAAIIGHEVIIIRAGEKDLDKLQDNYRVINIKHKTRRFLRKSRDFVAFAKKAKPIINKLNPDVVLASSLSALAGIDTKIPLVFRTTGPPVRQIFHVQYRTTSFFHWLQIYLDYLLQRPLEALVARSADGILCQSKELYDLWKKEYSLNSKFHTPCTMVDTSIFSPKIKSNIKNKLKISKNDPVILFSGGLSLMKGGNLIENVIKKSLDNIINLHVIFVGKVLFKPDFSKEHKKRVHFICHVYHFKIPLYYNAADVLIHVSTKFEGFPNSVMEAMACGLPIIANNFTSGISDYLKHNKNSLIFDNEKDLVNAIGLLVKNKNLRNYLSKNARITALNYDSKKVTKDIINFIKKI